MTDKQITRIKALTGIKRASCLTCEKGHAEHDGDYFTQYCGFWCSVIEDYIDDEDSIINIEAEKSCWKPNFWCAKELQRQIDICCGLDGEDNWLDQNQNKFNKLVTMAMKGN